jgi:PKD repeat protein
MKQKNYLVLVFFFLLALNSSAQTIMGCGTKLSEKEEAIFRQSLPKIGSFKKANKAKRISSDPYIIPVVFHILTDGKGSLTKAKMKCRIDDALLIANKDYNGLFPGFNNTDPRFDAVKSKLPIQFVMATVDPDGNLMETAGMDWHPEAHIVDGYDERKYNYMWYGKNGKFYLDVVIVEEPNTGQGTSGSGHAFLPIQDVRPHVTFNYGFIGSTCGAWSSPTFAKVFTHELGHYFGLKHTFEKNCDSFNDGMADTPPTTQGFGCNRTLLNSCGVYANLENHMDYNTDCQNMFTKDQVNAMTYWLDDKAVAKYPRGLLWETANLAATGVIPSAPIANISSDNTAICAGKSIVFNDISKGLPTTRTWTFEGGTPATSTEKSPTVVYNTVGKYKVTLLVSNSLGNNTKEIVDYIEVGQKSSSDFSEGFTGIFPPKGWSITNPDDGLKWEKRKDIGNGDLTCMIMNNADNSVIGAMDYIRLPFFDFSSGTNSQMYFDIAYTKFDDASPDVLKIQVSTDCEVTWHDVYSKTHTQLQTTVVPTELANDWRPTKVENWRKEVVDLSQYVGQSNVAIRFANKSGYGTRIWIDNVNVAVNNSSTPVSDFTSNVRRTNCNSLTVPFLDASLGNPTSWSWTFSGGTPATSTGKDPVVSYNSPGVYPVTLVASNANGTGSTVTKNSFIVVANPETTSFTEGFEGVFPPAGWDVTNTDYSLTWEQRTDVGHNSSSSMVMNDADNKAGNIDEITLKPLNLSTGITDFSFDVAYAKFDKNSPDILEVLISKDCGVTWDKLYSKTHTILETATSTDPNNWIPTLDSQWRTERILLEKYKGLANVLIKFKSVSGYGSRIWIDNVKFTFDSKEKPFADFNADITSTKCTSTNISFSDLSTGEPISWNWVFEGATPASSTEKNPVVTYNTAGSFKVSLTATNVNGTGIATEKAAYITVVKPDDVSFTQDFEGDFPPTGWDINNPDDGLTWEKRSDIGHNSTSCMIMNEADNETGDVDEIMLQPMDLSKGITDFSFDVAYAKYDEVSPDVLEVLMSKDCGVTWENVYDKTHTVLETAIAINDPLTDINEINLWTPTTDSDWRTERILLTKYKGEPNVLIKLRATSGFGSRIWVDNVKFNFDSKEKPVSDFVVKGKSSCSDLPIEFSDISTGEPTSWSWTFPGGTPATSTSQNPKVTYKNPGSYGVTLVATGAFGLGNKAIKKDFIVVKPKNTIPFTENFANDFPIQDWQVLNVDNDSITWKKSIKTGRGDSNCLVINNADAEVDMVDELIMKSFDFSAIETPYLHFDLGYTQYKNWKFPNDVSPDNIDILVSSDCGSTWKTVYSKNYLGLQTVSPPIEDDPATIGPNETNDWIPTHDSDWRNELIDLSIVKNQPNVLIKIVNTSGFGTRIWFDNFNINDSPEADPIGATISQTPVTCSGGVDGNDGTASVIATGGTGALTYSWSPSGGTAATATGLTKGEYTCTIQDTSLRTLVKTIKVGASVDNSLTMTSGILTVNQPGATYQWFKCPSISIDGAVNQSFEPVENGDYRVEVTFKGCTATSSCITFSSLSISDFEAKKEFVVYPNPSSGIVNFKSDFDGEFRILNQLGQTIKTFKVKSDSDNAINLEQLNEGVYFIHGMRGNKMVTRKVIIKK